MKKNLVALALLGINTAVALHAVQQGNPDKQFQKQFDEFQAFQEQLSPEAQEVFNSLDRSHKLLAVELTRQECRGKNACKGLGGCKTNEHACAGQNSCQGQGGDPIRDPNLAVEIAKRDQLSRRYLNQGQFEPPAQTQEQPERSSPRFDSEKVPPLYSPPGEAPPGSPRTAPKGSQAI